MRISRLTPSWLCWRALPSSLSSVFSSSGPCWFFGTCMRLCWGRYTLDSWGDMILRSGTLFATCSTSLMSHDIPNGAFYAKVRDGDVGLWCLRWSVPMLYFHRLSLNRSRLCNPLSAQNGIILSSKSRINSFFKSDLYSIWDGAGLAQSSGVHVAHSWVADGSYLMSGSEYVSALQERYNCLINRSIGTRGRDISHLCARGCAQPETITSFNSVIRLVVLVSDGMTTSFVMSVGL